MSTTLRILAILGVAATLSACGQQEEVVYVAEPVIMEPSSSKY